MEQYIREGIEEIVYYIEPAKREQALTMVLEKEGCKKYILSKYTPMAEAKELLGEDFGNKNTIWIFYGFGLGYMIEEVLKQCGKQTKIIIIEPSMKLLQAQIEPTNKQWLFNEENIKIYAGCEVSQIKKVFEENIPQEEINNFKVVSIKGYLEFYSNYYKGITKVLDEVTTDKIVRFNTLDRFGDIFLRNLVHNRYAIQKSYNLSCHKNKYQNIPALIVSGGPSLNKNIHLINQFKGMIFVGGRTLTPVLEQGVKPDFLVSIDPQPITFDTLQKNAFNEIPLITLDRGNDKVVEANSGPQYFIITNDITNELLGVNLTETVDQGGSVATVCTSMAEYMGCNPIIFIGQDLAYTNMKFHAEVCSDTRIFGKKNEVSKETNFEEEGYSKVISIDGGQVLTTPILITYLRWIEKFIERCPESEFINATEGGALIKGAINKSFQEVIKAYEWVAKPEIKHDKRQEKADVDANVEETLVTLECFKKLANKAEAIAKVLSIEYSKYKALRKDKINMLIKSLNKIDEQILTFSTKKNVVNYLFETAYTSIEREKKYKPKIQVEKLEEEQQVAEYSYAVYKKLNEVIGQVVKLIKEEINSHE